jgi:hypothetical protein
MPTTRKQIEALIERLEPTLRKAFELALADWRNNVDLDAIAAALIRGHRGCGTGSEHPALSTQWLLKRAGGGI